MIHQPVVLITGASSGIGRATAGLLARHDYRVFGTSRRPASAPRLPGVTFLALDHQTPVSVETCVKSLLAEAGRIDILINNAGQIGPGSASEETSLQTARALFETNFFGILQVTNAVLPVMRCQKSGMIVNISSTGGLISAPPFFSLYAATKHALEAYTEGLRYEVRPFGIRVALIEPGYTRTAIGDTIRPPDHPMPEYSDRRCRVTQIDRAGILYGSPPEIVARAILRVIRQKRPALRNLTGTDSFSIVLASRILPEPLFERLIEWMYTSWKMPGISDILPEPGQLGARRVLFHAPTRDLVIRSGAAAALACLGLAAGILLRRRSKEP